MAKVYSLEEALGITGNQPEPAPSVQGAPKKRTRGEAMSIVRQFEVAEGGMLPREARLAMIDDLMNGATFEIAGGRTGGEGSNAAVAPEAPKQKKVYSIEEALADSVDTIPDATESEQPVGEVPPLTEEETKELLYKLTPMANLEAMGDAAERAWNYIKSRITGVNADGTQALPAKLHQLPEEEQLRWADVQHDRDLRAAKKERETAQPPGRGFLRNLRNPMELLLNDSLPANILEWVAEWPANDLRNLMEARKVMMQERIIANPHQFPDVAVQAALRAKAERDAKRDFDVKKMWDDLKAAAEADPGAMGAHFVNAIMADPYMLLAPVGMGAKPIQTTRAAITGAETTSGVIKAADRVIDAGLTGAALNSAIEIGAMGADNDFDRNRLQTAALMGGILSGPFGIFFRKGSKAPDLTTRDGRNIQGALDRAIDATLAGEKEVIDELAGRPLSAEEFTEVQKALNELLGVRTPAEAAAWRRQREKDIKAAFKNNADYADYLDGYSLEIEEARNLAQRQAAERQAAEAEAARAATEATAAELPPANPVVDPLTRSDVREALDTPAFLRTAEQNVLLRDLDMQGAPGPDVGAPDNAMVIQALRKPPFQRTAEEVAAIKKSPLGKQSGKADPELLARTAVVAGAGTAAYALSDPENKIKNTLVGMLAGALTPAGGSRVLSRMRQAGAVASDGSLTWIPRHLKMADEAEVLAAAAKGDQRAMEALYKQYAPMLIRQMRPYLREAGPKLGLNAEDIVNEAFFKAFRNLEKFEGNSSFTTWVYQIAKNEALNSITKSGREVPTTSAFNDTEDLGPGSARAGHIVEGGQPLLRSDVEAASADIETPEYNAMMDEVSAELQRAFDKLSPRERDAVTMSDVQGFSNPEIAQRLGITENNLAVILNRGRAKIKASLEDEPTMRVPRGQRGSIDPDLIKTLGVAGAGAGIGAYLNQDNPAAGAAVGAALGFGARRMGPAIAKDADRFVGVVSTRVKNISPQVHHRLITLERKLLEKTEEGLRRVDPFLVSLNRLPKDIRGLLERAILTNDANVVNNLLREIGDPTLQKQWKEVRSVLDSFRDQLMAMGRFKKGITEYFPRIVKDYPGLLKALGQEHRGYVEKAIKEANDASIKSKGRPLTDIERSLLVNKILQSRLNPSNQPGFAKRRAVEDITPELQKYYATPTESLHTYIRAAVQDIEMAKFFGRDLKNVEKDGLKYTNIDASIGNVVDRLLKAEKITPEQALELRDLLSSRFTGGMKGSSEVIQLAKNLGNSGLLGNPISAITQFGDTILQAYTQDVMSAIEATVRTIFRQNELKMRDFGLATHQAEEFVSTTKSAKFLNTVFKYGGFSAVDAFGKNVALNAALIRARKLAKTPKGIAELKRQYGEAIPEGIDQLIRDLNTLSNSEEVRQLAFDQLSRSQPITRSELPQAYLDNPNGRVFYWLKTFMIKQIDLARRDGLNEFKKGNYIRGTKNLLKLGTALGLSGMTTEKVKQFIRGEKIDWELSDVPMNALKTFGLAEYTMNKIKSGRPVEAIGGTTLPPYRMMDEIIRADPKAVRYIPIIGPFLAPDKPKPKSTVAERRRRERREARRKRREG